MSKVVKTPIEGVPGRYLILHPNQPMSDEQRAWEMWAVHPLDLDRLGFLPQPDDELGPRARFFLAHIEAAKRFRAE